MVTKQQQLKWLAENHESWPYIGPVMIMSDKSIGVYYGAPMPGCHFVSFTEWQQERDKMQNEKSVITGGIYLSRNGFMFEVVDIAKAGGDCSIDMVVYMNLDATNDFPPGQKWVLELESFIRKFKLDVGRKPAHDNSWHERGEFPPAGCECEVLHRGKWIKTVIIGMSPYKSCVYSLIGSESDYAYDGIANSHFFRPIRTEREKVIDEMSLLAIGCEKYAITQNAAKAVCELLYDAGFRMEKPQ